MTAPDNAPSPAATPRSVAVLYGIFFVSGFCGLIYESIWSHYLKMLLGHAAYAQAVVLVVFVGGLAIGAWLTGRVSERIRRPVRAYALVEAIVALLAFGFQAVFERAADWAATTYLPAVCGGEGACAASWLLAAALILPASVLLGSTFPLMSAGVMRLGVRPGRGLSLLYFLNSLGAALGVLGSGFFLISALGLPGTILLAGAMNALVALAAYLADSTVRTPAPPLAAHAPAAAAPGTASQVRQGGLVILLTVAAVTGLSSFIYEVVWIRMLTLVLGAATHSFELMLSPFILGLALGAWWIRDRIDAAADAMRLLGRIQIVMGLLAMATLPLYAASFDGMAWAMRTLERNESGYLVFNVLSGLLAAAVMLPAAVCAGMTLPLITAILLRRGHGERQVGQVYGVNTLGAIGGVLLSVHLLIPLAGLSWSLAIGAGIDIALGLWLLLQARPRDPAAHPARALWPIALAGAAAMAVVAAMPVAVGLDPVRMASGVFRSGKAAVELNENRILFHQDGKTATITVLEQRDGVRNLLTNGKSDGATHPHSRKVTPDDHTMVLLGALGPVHHPQARTAAVIGLGTGTTSAVLLESPNITRVDTIEIEPMMVEAAQLFRPRNAKVLDDPRSRIIVDDARAHFAKTRAQYDLIISEPSNPWVSGVAGLFTVEFYRNVATHLAPDGHFVQWLHLYEASPELVASILRAFSMVFPDYRAYATNPADIVLVARNDEKPPAPQLEAVARMEGLRAQLERIGIHSAPMLAAHDTGRTNALQVLANSYGSPPNSDYFPYVDQRAAGDRYRKASASVLFALGDAPIPLLELQSGAPDYIDSVQDAVRWMPPRVQSMASGLHGLRYLRGETLEPRELAYLGTDLPHYELMRAWSRECRYPPPGSLWSPAVRVATDLHRGISEKPAAAYWDEILRRCGPRLSAPQRDWLSLFAAVGARDPARIAPLASRILASEPRLAADARGYLTLAAVASLMALDRRPEAAQILAQQRTQLPEDRFETAHFRYITMLLSVKAKAPAAATNSP